MSRCWVRVRLVALVGAAWLAVACSASKAAQAPTSQLAEGASTSMSAPASLPAAAPVPTQLRNVAQAPKRLSVEDCIRQWSSCTWDWMGQNNPEDPNVCKSRCRLQRQRQVVCDCAGGGREPGNRLWLRLPRMRERLPWQQGRRCLRALLPRGPRGVLRQAGQDLLDHTRLILRWLWQLRCGARRRHRLLRSWLQ